jgi:hypothetical protein
MAEPDFEERSKAAEQFISGLFSPPIEETKAAPTQIKPANKKPVDLPDGATLDPQSISTKEEVIESILKLTAILPLETDHNGKQLPWKKKSHMMPMKVGPLRELLGRLSEKAMIQVAEGGPPPPEKKLVELSPEGKVTSSIPSSSLMDERVAAHNLFLLNRGLMGFLEKTSMYWGEELTSIGIESDLDGAMKEMDERQKELEDIMVEIYRLHKPTLIHILTPHARLTLAMLEITGSRIQANWGKKKKGKRSSEDGNGLLVSSTT